MKMDNQNALQLTKLVNLEGWNDIILNFPGAHLLQTREWSSIKSPLGWSPMAYTWKEDGGKCQAACLLLKREVSHLPGLKSASILYAPRGPLLDWRDRSLARRVLSDLKTITQSEKSIFIKIDPEIILATGCPGTEEEKIQTEASPIQMLLKDTGWHLSGEQIQFQNTLVIDLTTPDTILLDRMKQKTRYNIHLAERKGVVVREGSLEDAQMLSKMYMETALRNGFAVREREYYERVWKILYEADMLTFLIADVESEPVAGLVLFHFGKRSYYFYGMSTERHREYMPTYLLQWKAIQKSRNLGCGIYDLWGAPDNFNESDRMWGVFRFKEGLGGQVIRTIGAWDFPTRPFLYRLYTGLMPQLLAVLRYRGRRKTIEEALT
jgi:peptidoglycan pentaglycine glycine transferase (the first glycine)